MTSGLGIDLGAGAIKVVRVRRRGTTWQVLRACKVPDPSPPPPQARPGKAAEAPPRRLPDGLRANLRAAGLSGRGALGVTGRDLMVKYVATPPVAPWKLRLMMDLEIKGTSGAEVCGDYGKLDIPGGLTREMVSLVSVARTDYIERQMALAREAGLGTEWCCPHAVALFNAFLASSQFRPGETSAVLDIGRDNLELVIQSDGVLYFARSAAGGGRQFTDAIDGVFNMGYAKSEQYKCARAQIYAGGTADLEPSQLKVSSALAEVADGLAAALRSATMFCRAQAKLTRLEVERIVLSGGGAQLNGLAEYLAKKTGLPVDRMDPASRLDISRLPAEQQALFDGPASAEMSVALGLAQTCADEGLFRLAVVPDGVVKARKFWRGTVWAIAAAAVLAGMLAVDVVGARRRRARAEVEQSGLEKKKRALEKKSKDVANEVAENVRGKRFAELLAGPAQRNVPVLGFLKLLREVTPPGITLGKLKASRPEQGSGGRPDQVLVVVAGRADPTLLIENVFVALKNYSEKLKAESVKEAFKIDNAKIVTRDPEGGDPRRPFTLTARISTLGLAEEREEEDPPGQGPALVPGRTRPPYLPSKPKPFTPPPPKEEPPKESPEKPPGGGGAF